MAVAVIAVVVGIALGFGGVQELYVVGIVGGQSQPFLIGLLGIATSILMIAAGVGIMRGWPQRRNLMLVAALLNVAFLVYSALPPHRNVGFFALLIGGVMSLVLAAKAYRLTPPVEAR